jgi:hypothetical protein
MLLVVVMMLVVVMNKTKFWPIRHVDVTLFVPRDSHMKWVVLVVMLVVVMVNWRSMPELLEKKLQSMMLLR